MIKRWLVCTALALAAATTGPALAATEVDLTAPGSQATINDAIFVVFGTEVSGSGLIDSFVRIQKNDTEHGYNTSNYSSDATLGPLDMKGGTFTHDLLVSDLFTNVVTIGGTSYYEFVLDINQTAPGALLSLEKLEIFVGPNATNTQTCTPPASGTDSNTAYVAGTPSGTLCGLNAVYSLDDAVNDYYIKLNYNNFPGSGRLDLAVLVPTALIGQPSQNNNDKVYLYSRFGDMNASNDGFEEWARKLTGTFVPIPGTLALLGLGFLALFGVSKLRRPGPAFA